MKAIWISLLTIIFSTPAFGFAIRTTEKGALVKWQNEQIDVYLSPSLNMLGPAEDVTYAIEDAFETWIYESEIDIEVNFIHEECTPGYNSLKNNTNCIAASQSLSEDNEHAGGNASITYSQADGEIVDGDIVFFVEAGDWKFDSDVAGLDFNHVALHEIGHFLGLTHSQIKQAVMYPSVEMSSLRISSLHEDDIYGALALYDSREYEEQTVCGFTPPPTHTNRGLLSFLFSLF